MKSPLISIDAEQAVIGAVLIAPQVYDDVSTLLPEDFAHEIHRSMWTMIRQSEVNRDLISLMGLLPDERIYIGELARGTPSAANVKHYAQIVKERSGLRKLAATCTRIASNLSGGMKAVDAIGSALREIERIGEQSVIGTGLRHVSELGGAWSDEFTERCKSGGRLVGLSTGFDALDARWGGMRGGQMIVVAGRPKRGKSTLAMNIAQHVAQTKPVCVFNMEMSANEQIDRSVSHIGSVGISDIRNGTADADQIGAVVTAWDQLSKSNLFIDDTPSQTIESIRLHAKSFVRKHGKGLIVIDYLQLMTGPEDSPYARVTNISRGIKLLAKETNCPVIAVVQMNRAIETGNRKPQLSDLRDSGAIEQDADIITFVHQDDDEQAHSEIITRAMRSGIPGTDYLGRAFGYSRFCNMADGWEPDSRQKPDDKNQNQARGIKR